MADETNGESVVVTPGDAVNVSVIPQPNEGLAVRADGATTTPHSGVNVTPLPIPPPTPPARTVRVQLRPSVVEKITAGKIHPPNEVVAGFTRVRIADVSIGQPLEMPEADARVLLKHYGEFFVEVINAPKE